MKKGKGSKEPSKEPRVRDSTLKPGLSSLDSKADKLFDSMTVAAEANKTKADAEMLNAQVDSPFKGSPYLSGWEGAPIGDDSPDGWEYKYLHWMRDTEESLSWGGKKPGKKAPRRLSDRLLREELFYTPPSLVTASLREIRADSRVQAKFLRWQAPFPSLNLFRRE